MKEKCLKMLSEYRKRRWRCHMWWKTVPKGGARNWKSQFANGREIEPWYCKLVGRSKLESLPRWHVSQRQRVTTGTLLHCHSQLGIVH